MANPYFTNTRTFTPGTTARGDEVDDKFDAVEAGFDLINTGATSTIKLTNVDVVVAQEIADAAGVRANKLLGFNASGNITLLSDTFEWKGSWTGSTLYRKGDIVKDTAGSLSLNSLYYCTTEHTSTTTIAVDSGNWSQMIDVTVIEAAQAAAEAAQAAAEAAQTAAESAQTAAETAETNADLERQYAGEWANKAEDSLVSAAAGGDQVDDYSALHHANKAAASAGTASTQATNASNSAIAAGNAQTAAEAAQGLAETAQTAAETAQGLAETAQGLAETAQAATEAVYDSFDDRYLGSKASAPTVDNDGNPLLEGAMYWNSSTNAMYVYDGSAWVTVANYSQINTTEVTATEGQTAFTTHSYTGALSSVYLNGSRLADADYTFTNATTVTLTTGATAGDLFELVSFEAIATPDNAPMLPARNGVLNQEPVTQGTSTRTGFSATKYTGNGTSNPVSTGVDMATGDFGGLVWIKERNTADNHVLSDTVRGTNSQLFTELTNAQSTGTDRVTAFTSSGINVGSATNVNENTKIYIAWSWQTNQKVEPTYGSELFTNPNFTTDTVWSKDSAWTISSGVATCNGTSTPSYLYDDTTSGIENSVCRLEFEITAFTSGELQISFASGAATHTGFTSAGTYVVYGQVTLNDIVYFRSQNFVGSIDNVSLTQITNSAYTNRGKPYTAHYNTDLGFSIVGYEGDGVNGHEVLTHLPTEAELTITKRRDGAGTEEWIVTSPLLGDDQKLVLNSTNAKAALT